MSEQRPGRPATARDEGAFSRSSVLLFVLLTIIAAGSAAVLLTR